jgi:hypothetical protein
MIKKFKENKPKNIKKRNLNDTKSKKSKSDSGVMVNNDSDTSETHFLITLPFNTIDLTNALGKPIETGDSSRGDKHEYEWKIMVGSNVFSIYNWMNKHNKFPAFEDNEWHLAGKTHNKKKIQQLCKFITENKKSNSHMTNEDDEYKEKNKKMRTINKKEMIEEENDSQEELENNLEETIELDIDDIDF